MTTTVQRRQPRLLWIAAIAIVAAGFLTLASRASALPGDPPISTLSPSDNATVPAAETIKVGYVCPAYTTAEEAIVELVEGEPHEGELLEGEVVEEPKETLVPIAGDSESYGVVFSTGSALREDGRLASTGFGEAGEAEAEAIKGTPFCNSELELPTSPNPAALYSGRVFWQAYRECEGCPSGYETGPLQSFVVVPTDEEAELSYEDHPVGGFLTKVGFEGEASLKGAKVLLQRWTGGEWATIAEEDGTASGANSFYVKLGAGRRLLRALAVGNGVSLALVTKAKTVQKPRQGEAPGATAGKYVLASKEERETLPLSFEVSADGTTLRGLTAAMEATCTGPTKPQDVKIEAKSTVASAPIAPTGMVVAHFATAGLTPSTVTLRGAFFNGRFSGVLSSSFLGNCSASREFEAVLAAPSST